MSLSGAGVGVVLSYVWWFWDTRMWWWYFASIDMDLLGVIWGSYVAGALMNADAKMWWGDLQDGVAEAVLWGASLWGTIGLLLYMSDWSWGRLGTVVVLWLMVGSVYWLRAIYRRFHWYESGRVGFVYWVEVVGISLGYLVYISAMGVHAFWPRFAWGLGSLYAGIFGLYALSGRKWRKDWVSFLKFVTFKKYGV